MTWGPGPVFVYEWWRGARRWQMYFARVLFLGLLLGALTLVWVANDFAAIPRNSARMAEVGASIFYAVIGTQLSLVLLAAPAATAGSVCMEKTRGTLLQLMST